MKKLLYIALMCLCVSALWGQNATPIPVPKIQFLDASGAPLAGGFVYTYAAGTTTELATYTDSTGSTPNTNPVVLDAGGFANIWLLGAECYKILVQNSNNVQISSTDNVCAPLSGGSVNPQFASPPPIGSVRPNLVIAQPLVTQTAPPGNATWNAVRYVVQMTGEYDEQFLTSTGSVAGTLASFYPWFTAPNQNPGWYDIKIPTTEFLNWGGFSEEGAYGLHIMPDPQPGSCTLTHAGGTGTGVTYYVYFLDATGGLSQPTTCTDATGFTYAELGGGKTNTLSYSQPGGYSNMLPARDLGPYTVVNDPGHAAAGVYSTLTACLTATPCTWTDDGSWGNISLSSLVGAFYRYGTNSTADMYIAGRPWMQAGLNVAGTQVNEGGLVVGPLANPTAPSVHVNTTGSTTVTYYTVLHTYSGKTSAVSPAQTITNSAATHDNLITVNGCWPNYDTWDLLIGSTVNSLVTGLPCSTTSNSGGVPQPYVFHDTGQSTSVYPVVTNTTADMSTTGNFLAGMAIQAGTNSSAPTVQATDGTGGHGYIEIVTGNSGSAGQMNYHMPGGASLPLTTDGSNLIWNGSILSTGTAIPSGVQGQFFAYGVGGTPASVTNAFYSPTLWGMICNDPGNGSGTDDTSAFQTLVNLIGSTGNSGTIDFRGLTNQCLINSARITFPAGVNLLGCGRATYNSSLVGFVQPKCGLNLEYNDTAAKLFYPNSGSNYIVDMNIQDGGSDVAPFIVDTNAELHFVRSSLHGTQSCSAGSCGSGLSNPGISFGGLAMPLTSVANHSGSNTTYTGTIYGGLNTLTGQSFVVTGFTNSANNGTFPWVSSTATTITLGNNAGVSETPAKPASALSNTFSATLPTGYFSGYGASIDSALFDNISTAIFCGTNCNQVFMNDIDVTSNSGNPTGAAIVFDGAANQSVANKLFGGLIETKNYLIGAQFINAASNEIRNFSCWDGNVISNSSCLNFDALSQNNMATLGFYSGSVTGVVDANGNNNVFDPKNGWFGKLNARNHISGTYISDMNKTHTLTTATPVTVLQLPLNTDLYVGGTLNYTIYAVDGSHHVCAMSSQVYWSGVNSNGTYTTAVSTPTGAPATACSSGLTLGATWGLSAANPANLQVTATAGGFTPTSFSITYTWNNQAFSSPTE